MVSKTRRILLSLASAPGLLLGACGSDDSTDTHPGDVAVAADGSPQGPSEGTTTGQMVATGDGGDAGVVGAGGSSGQLAAPQDGGDEAEAAVGVNSSGMRIAPQDGGDAG